MCKQGLCREAGSSWPLSQRTQGEGRPHRVGADTRLPASEASAPARSPCLPSLRPRATALCHSSPRAEMATSRYPGNADALFKTSGQQDARRHSVSLSGQGDLARPGKCHADLTGPSGTKYFQTLKKTRRHLDPTATKVLWTFVSRTSLQGAPGELVPECPRPAVLSSQWGHGPTGTTATPGRLPWAT